MTLLKQALIKKVITFFVNFICSALLFTLAFILCDVFSQRLPRAIELVSESGVGINYKKAQELYNKDNTIGAAFSTSAIVSHNNTAYSVYMIASTPTYGQLLGLSYLSGGYFLNSNASYAVLPQALALQMFNTTDIVGNEVIINNKYYTICGVYKNRTGFLDKISDAAVSKIFVSSAEENEQITHLLIASDDGIGTQQRKAQAEASSGISFAENVHDLRAPESLSRLIVYIAFLVALSLPLYWAIKSACKKMCTVFVTPLPIKKTATQIFISVALITGVCIALFFALSNIKIAQIYLPTDNIFDFAFYGNLLISFFTTVNTIKEPINFYPVINVYCTAILSFSFFAAFFARKALYILRKTYYLYIKKELLS